MSSSDESDEDIPEVSVCQLRCEQFAEITGTDTACAQFYLQDRKWDLDQSVNDFFEDRSNKGAVRVNDKNEASVVLVVDESESRLAAAATAVLAESATTAVSNRRSAAGEFAATAAMNRRAAKRKSTSNDVIDSKSVISDSTSSLSNETNKESPFLKFISWNIDGLNEKNLKLRTKAVCTTIIKEQADIIFLQEVVPESAEYLLTNLANYECLFGNEEGYFVATLLKKSSVTHSEVKIIEFPHTRMMRNALKVNVIFRKHNLRLYNSHLESTPDGHEERKEQLTFMWKKVLTTNENTTVIFGGDLNLRDSELKELGGLPAGIEDLWVSCGSRKECAYTFDLTRNDNLIFNGKYKPRCRFDRVYVRHSAPRKLKPIYFGLIGLERLLPHRCFPSDHWGILSHFEIE